MEEVAMMVPGLIGVQTARTKVGALVVNMGVEGVAVRVVAVMVVLVMMAIVMAFWGGRHYGENGEGVMMVLELVVMLTMA